MNYSFTMNILLNPFHRVRKNTTLLIELQARLYFNTLLAQGSTYFLKN